MRAMGRSVSARARRLTPLGLALGVLLPAAAHAWPAVQDGTGIVHLCDSRPTQLSDGFWTCRSGPWSPTGTLLEVARPGVPPGVRPWDTPRGGPYRYVPYPWGPPPREPSGYDALDPWLGGPSER
jgi:hypothetical protein